MIRSIDRRSLLAGGLAGGAALTFPRAAFAAAAKPSVTELQVSPTRKTRLFAWTPAVARGVLLFSHGHGSWPERYALLADWLTGQGYAVMAPVHVDSMRYPDRDRFTREASFGERIADLAAVAGAAAEGHPGLPLGVVGHSFGTLSALCMAGGLASVASFRVPAVKTVVGFSSPGKVPGLITDASYASVETPVMIVTGTQDIVPGLVTDPADHLLAVTAGKGMPRYGLTLAGGTHELVADPALMAKAEPSVALFLAATMMGDTRADGRLEALRVAAPDVLLKKVR